MFCCAHVSFVHEPVPHCPETPPPPHVFGGVQLPQLSAPPHPSPAGPQEMFCDAHDLGAHVG
jgi:hypothetical protein